MNHAKQTYTYQEAADLLGMSKATLYRKVKAGHVKSVSPVGVPRIHADEVERILAGEGASNGRKKFVDGRER
jgi:excisionase family DNA binding protein